MKSLAIIWLAVAITGIYTVVHINNGINQLVQQGKLVQLQSNASLEPSKHMLLQALPQDPEFQQAVGIDSYQNESY